MKKLSLALLITSLLLNVRADITTGLVGYWSLSDGPGNPTVADLSGNGNTGTLKNFADTSDNTMWTTASDPQNGWPFAMNFTNNLTGYGTNTYITVADAPGLDLPATNKTWTLSAWVKPSEAGTLEPRYAGIIAKGNQGAEAYALYMNDTAGSGKFQGIFHNNPDSGGETAVSGTTALSNTWYNVVCVVSVPKNGNSEAFLYVNGTLEYGTNANTYTTVYGTNLPVTIGSRSTSAGVVSDTFVGTIDEVRIYDRALSASDVLQLYQNKAFSIINNGIGYWNGLAGSSGSATLDTSSLNFCTNIYSAPLGTAATLGTVLTVENAGSLPLGCAFPDTYYSSGRSVLVASTNINITVGGVALGTAGGAGTLTFLNNSLTYSLNSQDAVGLKDGANPTSLVQSGSGTAILTGINTFSGGTTINSGTVQVGNGGATASPLGSGPVTDDSLLVFYGNDSPTFNNNISGTGAVIQKGSGTLKLNAANTYSGGTSISNGAVNATSLNDSACSLGTGPVTMNSATVLYTGSGDSTVRQFNGVAGTTNIIDVPSGITLEIQGRVTGVTSSPWYINKVDTGTLTLSGTGDNTDLGMNVNAGTVILNKTSGTGHAIGEPLNVASGATVQLAGGGYPSEINNVAAAPVTISSGGVFDANSAADTFYSLSLSGTGSGSGALINSAASTIATLTVSVIMTANATIGGPGSITLPGVVSGSGVLTYAGAGVLELQNVNTYTAGAVVSSGTLDGNVSASLPGSVTVTGTGILQMDMPNAMSTVGVLTLPASPVANSVYLNYSGSQTISLLVIGSTVMPGGTYGAPGSGATITNIAAFTGTGTLQVTGPAYWDPGLSDASPGSGGTGNWNNSTTDWFTGSADTVFTTDAQANFAGTAGTVTLAANVNADALNFSTAGYTITNTDGVSVLTLDGTSPNLNIPAGNTTMSCAINVSGSNPLTVNGSGTLTLSGASTYGTGTTINGATLNAATISDSGTSALGQSGTVTIQGGGTLGYIGAAAATTARNVTANGAATSTLNVPAGSLTLSGQLLAGTGGSGQIFTKTGTGTLFLGGSVDNSALTMAINQGEVVITKSSASNAHGLGGGTSTVASGAELQLNGSGTYELYSGCLLNVSNGAVLDLDGQTTGMSTLTIAGGGFGGTGALINSAPTTTSILTNANGGFVLAAPTTVGGAGNIMLVSIVNGSGPVTYAGSGTLTLVAANTYSGGTTINSGGAVQLNGANAAGTGTITDNGVLAVNIAGSTLTNTVTGGSSSVVNVIETSGDNLSLNGPMSGFSGTINFPTSPGSTAKGQIESNCNLPATATNVVAAGGTLFLSGSTNAATVVLNGFGNSEVYGALRLDAGIQKGPVTLNANTSIGNGGTTPGIISGPISDGGNGYGITKTATANTVILTGTNAFTGTITNSQGLLEISGAGCLGATAIYATNIVNSGTLDYASSVAQTLSGVVSGAGQLTEGGPGTLTLSSTNTFTGATMISNTCTLTISGTGCLGFAGTTTNYAGAITNFGTFNYAGSAAQTLSGAIAGTGNLIDNGPGSLTLSGANSYTGNTSVTNGGTLVLASGGSINSTPALALSAGTTFDVSAYGLAYALGAGTTLKASGTGTGIGTTAATVKGGSGATVTIGSLSLNFTPQNFSGDATHPALYISSGALNFSGSGLTVNNMAGTPLGLGTYSLVQVQSGSVSASSTNVTVTGTGLAPGTAASLGLSGGSLNLMVYSSVLPVPAINSLVVSGSSLIFSGTNGLHGGNYYVLTTTNLLLPLSQWMSIATDSFTATGTFSVTNAIGSNPGQFYSIEIP